MTTTSYAQTPYGTTPKAKDIYAKLTKTKAYHRSPTELLREGGWLRGYVYLMPKIGSTLQMAQEEKNGHKMIDNFVSGIIKTIDTTADGIIIETENAQFVLKLLEN